MENKYWFTLYSPIFVWKKREQCYLYDSDRFIGLHINIKDSWVMAFIDDLRNIDNLYCISLNESQFQYLPLKELIYKLRDNGFGKLVKQNNSQRSPIQLPPILNLQSEVNRLNEQKLTDLTVGEHVLNNLSEIHIVLSYEVTNDFVDSLIAMLDSISRTFTGRIILSGYIPQLNGFKRLWNHFEKLQVTKTFIILLKNISKGLLENLNQLQISNIKIIILASSPWDSWDFSEFKDIILPFCTNAEWEFQVTSEKEYYRAEEIISYLKIDAAKINPYYDGKNIMFFKKHIYLEEGDIEDFQVSKKDIFAHQVLNTFDFGKFTILPNGKIYANPYFPALGTIQDDIRELVYIEMNKGTSWRRIREMEPCCDCIYQWLCPSPSNYEIEIGKPNLCHVID